jgi:heptosyltransferase III
VNPEKAIEYCRNAKKILILKTNLLGDVLNFLPVANFLRKTAGAAKISWLVSRPGYMTVSELADVDELVLLEDSHLYNYGNLLQTASWIRERKFDLLVTSYQEECFLINLLALMSRVPERVGYNLLNRGWFFNTKVPKGDAERRVEINGQIIKALGGGDWRDYVYVPRDNPESAARFAGRLEKEWGIRGNEKLCVLHLLSPKPTRSWRLEYCEELVRRLQKELDLVPVLVGSEPDTRRWGEEKKPPGLKNLAGQINLLELYYVLRQARLFIGIDSLPLQLTEFSKTRALALFGSTEISKALVPLATTLKADFNCAPCWPQKVECDQDYRCWRELKPDLILEAAKQVMEGMGV